MEVFIFLLGSVAGAIFTGIVFWFFLVGNIRVDCSDPFDGPYLFLELSKEVQSVINKPYIVLRVKTENFAPRK